MKRLGIFFLAFTFLSYAVSINSASSFAENNQVITEKDVILYSEDEEIILYEDSAASTPMITLPINITVNLVTGDANDKYSLIHFTNDDGEIVEGYVNKAFIVEEKVNDDIQDNDIIQGE